MNKAVPPLVNVRRLKWYRDGLEERWWRVGERWEGRDVWRNAIVDVSRSRTGAETTVAVPVQERGELTGVFGVKVPFIHFVDPVVPPGFGFAIVDDRGTVVFHSEKERALSENLFEEADEDRHLRAVVHARRDERVSGRYWGVDHQMYIAPVPGTPWTVVAMRDETVLRMVNTEGLAMTALLVASYAGLYACIFVLLAILKPDYRAPWLWPDAKRLDDYVVAAWVLVLECIALTASVVALAPPDVMAVGFIAPIRGLASAYLIVNRGDRNWQWRAGLIGSAVFTILWGVLVARGEPDPVVMERGSVETARVLLLVLVAVPYARSCGLAEWLFEAIAAGISLSAILVIAGLIEDSGAVVAVAIVLIVYVLLAAAATVHRRWRRPPPNTATMRLYRRVGVAMLVISAVLPAIAFLKTAMRVGVDARVKHAQLRLADMLERRLNLLERLNARVHGGPPPAPLMPRGLRVASDCYSLEHAFASAWTLEPRSTAAYLMTYDRWRPRPDQEKLVPRCCDSSALRAAWIPDVIQWMLPQYSEGSVAIRDLHHDTASDRTWQWWRRPRDLTLRRTVLLEERTLDRLYPDRRRSEPVHLLIRSAVPQPMLFDRLFGGERRDVPGAFLKELNCTKDPDADAGAPLLGQSVPFEPSGTRTLPLRRLAEGMLIAIVLIFAAAIPGQAVGFLGKRVFLFDDEAPWTPDGKPIRTGTGMHLFIERRPSVPLEKVVDPSSFHVVDLTRACRGTMKWSDLIAWADRAPDDKDLLVLGLDNAFASRELSDGVPMFFDEIFESERHTVVVVSTVSPAAVIAVLSGKPRRRWQQILDRFARIDTETFAQVPVPSRFDQESRRRFERIWSDSSPDERLMLYQITRDGLANGKDRNTLRRLFARKLVHRSPELELATPAFEDFVRAAARREDVSTKEKVAPQPQWRSLTVAGIVLVGTSLIVLLTTQKEVINLTTGIITALAAGIPAILKLAAALHGKTPADPS